MDIKVFNLQGEKISSLKLDEHTFGIELHKETVFTSIIAENASNRQGTHSTKTKAEVSGGGKKPWAQKGTGNARQGSTRNPQWRHGGVAFGPKPNKNYTIGVNRKAHKLALASALSEKFATKKYLVVEELNWNSFSTKKVIKFLADLKIEDKKVLIISHKFNEKFAKSVSNLVNIQYELSTKISVKDIVEHDFIILDVESAKYYNEVLK